MDSLKKQTYYLTTILFAVGTLLLGKAHANVNHHFIEIQSPVVVHSPALPIMVYDAKDHLINASFAVRAGVSKSDHHNTYTVWFDDGDKRHHMRRIFDTKEEADLFLESIYNIKE